MFRRACEEIQMIHQLISCDGSSGRVRALKSISQEGFPVLRCFHYHVKRIISDKVKANRPIPDLLDASPALSTMLNFKMS